MVSIEKNIYFLKQSDGTIWNFLLDEKLGIVYKIYKENKWTNITILTRKTTGKYSVDLLPDDTICLIYENFNGQLIMKLYANNKWSSYYIIENQSYKKIDIYFKTIFHKNNLLLFYSIYNKETNILTINSHIIDKKGILSSPSLVDEFEFENNIFFSISSSTEDIIYIMYQKKENDYTLGYKIYNNNFINCSEFYKIDESPNPFKDYYFLSLKDEFHSIYTKIDNNKTFLLTYYKGNLSSTNSITIFRSKNSFHSSLFIFSKYIWCFWFKDSELFSTVSIDGGLSFSKPYQVESLKNYSTIYKASYISNFLENGNILCMGEAFAINISSPKLLVIDDIYRIIYKNTENTTCSFYLLYFISFLNSNYTSFKVNIHEKDKLIQNQSYIIEKQKNELLEYENKFNSISKLITSFNENRLQLNEGISLLQDTLDDKEKKYNDLKKIYSEKEIELDLLKATIKKIETENSKIFNIKKIFAKLFFYKD